MSGTLQAPNPARAAGTAKRTRLPDVLGIAWVLAAGVAVLVPALIHGIYLGPTDILSTVGLTAQHGTVVHNPTLRDQIAVFIPWIDQAWSQVHHGQLPLWNPYSGLGMPLAFSWQSTSFGFPTLIGYLVPVKFAFTAGLFVIVVVSGTGAYVFAGMLRLGVLASALVGTVFVLSGPISSQLGWPMASVMSWAGWLFASALLVVRGKRRARSICAFAIVLALAIYAGHPEVTILLLVALGIYLFVVLVQRAPRLGASGPIVQPVVDLIIGSLAGVALAAPLVLPGLQLIGGSVASTTHYGSVTTPDHAALQLLFQGFDGLPISSSHWFGSLSYQSTAAYFGVIALVLVVVAVGTRWRRPEVTGLAAVSVVMASLVLLPAIPTAVNDLPLAGTAYLTRAFMPMAFGLSVLAGIGLDALVRDHAKARVRRWALCGFAVVIVVLVVVWSFGRGHLPPDETRIREASFLWPVLCVVVGLTVLAGLTLYTRRNPGSAQIRAAHVAGGILLACETAFWSQRVPRYGLRAHKASDLPRRSFRSRRQWVPLLLVLGRSHASPRNSLVLRSSASCRRPTTCFGSISWPSTTRSRRSRTTRSGAKSRARREVIPISNSSVPSSSPSLWLGSSEWPMSSKLAAPKVQLAVCLSKRWVTKSCTESPMLHRPQFRRLRPASRCPQTQRMELQSPFNIPTPGRGALLPTPRLPRSSDYVLPMFRVGTPRSMVGLWPSSSFQG